jgi:hypothetical protein
VITRYNKKTVTVITDAGQRWNVAPQFLRRASGVDRQPVTGRDAIRLPGK